MNLMHYLGRQLEPGNYCWGLPKQYTEQYSGGCYYAHHNSAPSNSLGQNCEEHS